MTPKKILLPVMLFLVVFVGLILAYVKLKSDNHRKITFEECEKVGGTARRVDLYDPDRCPDGLQKIGEISDAQTWNQLTWLLP